MIERLRINWDWVKKQILKTEGIPISGKNGERSAILPIMEECLKIAMRLSEPRHTFVVKRITAINHRTPRRCATVCGNRIEFEGGVAITSKFLVSSIKGANSACIFVVTIGGGLEERSRQMMKDGEHLEGYLLDRIASFAVESLAESFETNFRSSSEKRGESVSMRFSPGYCDWRIEEQFLISKILDFSKAGVRLNENCMMVPLKSISALIGIGPGGLFAKRKSQCGICDKKATCDYRRVC